MPPVLPAKLYHCIIRIPKAQAAFTYFVLEANEGPAFYSTLSSSLRRPFRDIEIFAPLCWKGEILEILHGLRQEYPVDILQDGEVEDARGLGQEFSTGGLNHAG